MEKQTKQHAIKEAVKKCPFKKECEKIRLCNSKEKDWILNQIEVALDSYRGESDITGLTFEGTFSENLGQGERKIMESIFRKLKKEDAQ